MSGAASGMGRLAARQMAALGARVAALDVNAEGLRVTAEGRPNIFGRVLDVTDRRAVERALREIEAELGPIDRLYNAAAIMPTAPLLDQDIDTILRIMEINYNGVALLSRLVLPGMIERGHGDLINFASMAGWVPALHFGAYNASKFAVVALTEVLYHELRGRGVRICCVCPPPVDTPLLAQAKSRPRILEELPPIQPEQVLQAIERALESRRLWVFPGRGTRTMWRLRRWLPGLVWWNDHRVERRGEPGP